jgi:hypothetical protein
VNFAIGLSTSRCKCLVLCSTEHGQWARDADACLSVELGQRGDRIRTKLIGFDGDCPPPISDSFQTRRSPLNKTTVNVEKSDRGCKERDRFRKKSEERLLLNRSNSVECCVLI